MASISYPLPQLRSSAVAIARSWLKTPYVLQGRVKGAGVDCATLLAEYLIEIGTATKEEFIDLGLYSGDWFQHTSNERYLTRLMRYAPIVAETICRGGVNATPGSLALFRVVGSKRFNHGGIIVNWPRMIHAAPPEVREINAVNHWLTGHKEVVIFDPWGKV